MWQLFNWDFMEKHTNYSSFVKENMIYLFIFVQGMLWLMVWIGTVLTSPDIHSTKCWENVMISKSLFIRLSRKIVCCENAKTMCAVKRRLNCLISSMCLPWATEGNETLGDMTFSKFWNCLVFNTRRSQYLGN